jgi:hypothetical protein
MRWGLRDVPLEVVSRHPGLGRRGAEPRERRARRCGDRACRIPARPRRGTSSKSGARPKRSILRRWADPGAVGQEREPASPRAQPRHGVDRAGQLLEGLVAQARVGVRDAAGERLLAPPAQPQLAQRRAHDLRAARRPCRAVRCGAARLRTRTSPSSDRMAGEHGVGGPSGPASPRRPARRILCRPQLPRRRGRQQSSTTRLSSRMVSVRDRGGAPAAGSTRPSRRRRRARERAHRRFAPTASRAFGGSWRSRRDRGCRGQGERMSSGK